MEHVAGDVLAKVATAERLDARSPSGRRGRTGADAGRVPRARCGRARPRRLQAARDPREPAAAALAPAVGRVEDARVALHRRSRRAVRDAVAGGARGQSLVHGDYHLGNALVALGRRVARHPRLGALQHGRPARRRRPDGRVLGRVRRRRPRRATGSSASPSPTLPGFPSAAELAREYADAASRRLDDLGFWVAFAYWKVAIIVEGVYRRWLNDPTNGSDAGTASAGRRPTRGPSGIRARNAMDRGPLTKPRVRSGK